mmetsp:Transcript_2593/g.7073  ORF Transcript_2593/g.7073 Transcript_2593/m.7073 type:complete len:208 (-) Transcript_2593:584-1207(-)
MELTCSSPEKSLLTKSKKCSAGLVAGGNGCPMEPKYGEASPTSPENASRPRLKIMTWSKPLYTLVDGWWMVQTMMRFSSLATREISCMMLEAAAASSPLVGSSRNSTVGCFNSATAMLSLRFWPPLRRAHRVSAHTVRPILLMRSSTMSGMVSVVPTSYSPAAYIRLSRVVRYGQCLSCCFTTKQCFLKSLPDSGTPFSVTDPDGSP